MGTRLTHVRHEKQGLIWMPNHLASVTGTKAWVPAFSLSFPEVCSLSDLANIADPDQVLNRSASGKTL